MTASNRRLASTYSGEALAGLGFILLLSTPLHSLADQAARDRAVVETLLRLPSVDVNGNPKLKQAVLRHLETQRRTVRYVELVDRLNLRGAEDELVQIALADPDGNLGVKAATLLVKRSVTESLDAALDGADLSAAVGAATVLGHVGTEPAQALLRPLVTDLQKSRALRNAAAAGLGRSRSGQQYLLKLVREQRLPPDLHFVVANTLYGSSDPTLREQVANYLQLPAVSDSKPLPPVSRLVAIGGDAARGEILFHTKATCGTCHQVNGRGKAVGPDLSEIGSKLTREAMFVAILDPSAGISHNYETYSAILDDGNLVSGILVSQTSEAITLRTAEAIDKTFRSTEIDEIKKDQVSLMPADLQKLLSVQELVDTVEYMMTLREKK